MRWPHCGILVAISAFAAVGVASCGGSGDADGLFQQPSGTSGGSGGAAGHGGGMGGQAGFNEPDASAGGQSTGGSGGSGQGGQGGSAQGGGGGSPPVDAGPPPITLRCGPQLPGTPQCSIPPEVCCVSFETIYAAGKCVNGEAACSGGTVIECTGPKDCPPGNMCCGTLASVNVKGQEVDRYSRLACQPQCDPGARILCTKSAEVCPSAQKCGDSVLLPSGFLVCQQK